MTATHVNNSDPRVKRTRQLLLQAFIALVEETHDLHAISVQDIAERATVNRATFYAHFEDKYALLETWMRAKFQHALQSQLPVSSALAVKTLRALTLVVFDFLANFRHYMNMKPPNKQFEPLFEVVLQQELYAFLLNWLHQIPSQTPARQKTVEITATTISWAIFGPAVQWSREKQTCSAEEMADQVLTIVVAGLSPVVTIA